MPKPPEPRAKTPSRSSIPDDPPRAKGESRLSSPELPLAEPLAEVERALSILQGRHPDAVRAERETTRALAAKKLETEERAKKAAKDARRRWIVTGVALVVLGAAGASAWTWYSARAERARQVEGALASRLAPYLAQRFTPLAPSRFAQDRVELDVTEPTCLIAFASRSPGDGALIVERPQGPLTGEDSIAWCTCGAEKATIRLRDPLAGGLGVVGIAAAQVGGDDGLSFLSPLPRVIAPPDPCSRDSLDAWIDKGAPVRPRDDALDEDTRGALARVGFRAVGSVTPGLPFGVVPGAGDTCALAWSTVPGDLLSLRLPGGERVIKEQRGPLGLCQSHAANLTVWRKGQGEVVVEHVSSNRVGGSHGLHELAPRLGLPPVDAWVSDADLAWDAAATLRATGIAPPEITVSTDGRPVPHARLVALTSSGATVRPDARENSGYACEPALTATSRSFVCVQSAALAWRVLAASGKAGIAESPLPFWLQAFAGATDPAALSVQLGLAKLSRRLVAEGFEATTLEGVTEVEGGAVVLGRAGDDAIVAVQLTREAPWAAPCTTGEPWTLAGDPAIVSVTPGQQVKITCGSRGGGQRDRRTVVFRHLVGGAPSR